MFYVSCIDTFLSGWGKSKGKKNKLIFECKNDKEVEQIAALLEDRSEMKYIDKYTDNFPKSLLTSDKGEYKTESVFYQLKNASEWLKYKK
jgi:hypothetical protein